MKYTLVLALCVAAALAAPQQRPQDVQVLSETKENDGSGNFKTAYALSDGTNRDETGEFRAIDAETGIQKVTGVISWVAPDGQVSLNQI
ncbi:unnamed protein product [Allacma fusca]|uniref:Uncharacterized protein n=1 Tax=Allacma fusca TaxID=39272 RepID=A0A8J2KML1_9HEXA|nr:unnamed protein product [Allacma fusca]